MSSYFFLCVQRLRQQVLGAVYVEFLIAFLPILLLFFCLLQMALLCTLKLAVDSTAVSVARAASMLAESEAGTPASDERKQEIRNVALLRLSPFVWTGAITEVQLFFPETSSAPVQGTQVDQIRVRLEVKAVCSLPIARTLCTWSKKDRLFFHPIHGEATFPYQGVRYR